MHNGCCFHTDQTNCHTASSREASPRPCNWCKQVNIHADCVFTAHSCVQVPPLPSQGGQSAQLPPLLSASVHSQQDSSQLGSSCAASFMMHKPGNTDQLALSSSLLAQHFPTAPAYFHAWRLFSWQRHALHCSSRPQLDRVQQRQPCSYAACHPAALQFAQIASQYCSCQQHLP